MHLLQNCKILVGCVVILLVVAVFEGWIIHLMVKNKSANILLPNYFYYDPYRENKSSTDDYVSVSGSWISDTKLAMPAQTSTIDCYKDWGYCLESDAGLIDNFLQLNKDLYEIDTWTKDYITTKPSGDTTACVDYIMRIDRINKKVVSLRTTKNTSGLCEGIQDEPIGLYLGNGTDRLNKINSQ